MKKITIFLILTLTTSIQAKEIAISFDDAPRRLTGQFTAMERAKNLVKEMKGNGVNDAVFYCNSSFITDENKKVIQYYNDQGFTIANHTHTHPSLNNQRFEDYKKDFLTADEELSQFSNFKRYFRFPYLREGSDEEKRDKMRDLLKKMKYINGYVTVDFSDWHIESLFRESIEKKEKVGLEKLKELYLSLAKESLEHYEKLSAKYLGRSPKHVLLLHETDIAALFIGDLIKALRSWGWKIISSEEAYKDGLSQFEINRVLKANPGRVGEIAIEKGHPMKDVWANSTYTKYITKRYKSEVVIAK